MGNAVTEKHSSFKTAFPIASAWFGALVGPSMVSGVYALVYFAPYGAWAYRWLSLPWCRLLFWQP